MRNWLSGKRTYLTAAIAVLSAVAAWSSGQIDAAALVATILGALTVSFQRSAITTEVAKILVQDEKK